VKNIKRTLLICYTIQLAYIPLILYMVIVQNILFGSGLVAIANMIICILIFANIFSDNLKEMNPDTYEKLSYEDEYRTFGSGDTSKPVFLHSREVKLMIRMMSSKSKDT